MCSSSLRLRRSQTRDQRCRTATVWGEVGGLCVCAGLRREEAGGRGDRGEMIDGLWGRTRRGSVMCVVDRGKGKGKERNEAEALESDWV